MRTLCRILLNLFSPKSIARQIKVGRYFSFIHQKCEDVDKRIMTGDAVDAYLPNLTWPSIIFGPYQYCGKPLKNERRDGGTLKWVYIRIFYIDLLKMASSLSCIDFIFSCNESKQIIFGHGRHVGEIFMFHNPDTEIKKFLSLPGKYKSIFLLLLANFCLSFHKIDNSEGQVYLINVVDQNFLSAFRKIHPNKKIVLRLHDIYEEIFCTSDVEYVRGRLSYLLSNKIVDWVESYSKEDAEKLEIHHVYNKVRRDLRNFSSDEKYLWMFVGHASNGADRLNDFKIIKDYLSKKYPNKKHFELIVNRGDKLISYEEYIDILGKSRMIVDLYRIQPDEGWSFRISEALVMRKKVITNRANVKKAEAYHPSRFFIIDEDEIDRLTGFIESPYKPVPDKILNQYCI